MWDAEDIPHRHFIRKQSRQEPIPSFWLLESSGTSRECPLSATETKPAWLFLWSHCITATSQCSRAPTVSSCHCSIPQWVFWQGIWSGTFVCTFCCDEQAHLRKSCTGNPIPCSQLHQTQCLLWLLHEPHGLLKSPGEVQKADLFIRPRFAGQGTTSHLGNILGPATQKRLKIQFISSAENHRHSGMG